jgi:hypothetical protein
MPEGQELLQAGGGGAAFRSTSAQGVRGSGSSAARPVTTPIARAARCSTGSGIPLNAACSASPSAAAICSVAKPRSIAAAHDLDGDAAVDQFGAAPGCPARPAGPVCDLTFINLVRIACHLGA